MQISSLTTFKIFGRVGEKRTRQTEMDANILYHILKMILYDMIQYCIDLLDIVIYDIISYGMIMYQMVRYKIEPNNLL